MTAAGPVLVDFGLARDARVERERLTRTGEVLGTPEYMAPEQADGDPDRVDPRADVYALGATLHALLRGAPPFRGGSALEVLRQVLLDPPPRAGVDPALDAIVLRCLHKDPAARYPGAAELARALEAWSAAHAGTRRATAGAWTAAVAILLAGAGTALLVARPGTRAVSAPGTPAPPSSAPGPTAPQPAEREDEGERRLAATRELLRRRAWSDLEPASAALVAAAPLDPRAWRLRGEALLRRHVYRPLEGLVEAEEALREAARLDPADPDARALLAICRASRQDPGWIADAEEALRLGRESSGMAWAVELIRVMVRLREGDRRPPPGLEVELRALRDQALALAPDSLHVHHVTGQLGLELLSRGLASPEEALEGWRRGLALDPDDPFCLTELGFVHETAARRQGDLTGAAAGAALEAYDQAIRADPDYWYAWLQRGSLRQVQGQHRLAIPDLERACALHPGHAQAAWLLVLACSGVAAMEDGMAALDECLRREPNHAGAHDAITHLPPQARRLLENLKVLESEVLLAELPRLLATRTWVMLELVTARLTRELPGSARAWFFRGEALMRSSAHRGDPTPLWAQPALEEACRLDPAWADARALLAICRAQRGDRERAASDAARALTLAPENGLAWAATSHLRAATPGADRRAWAEEVRGACQRALSGAGDSPWVWFEVGEALRQVADLPELHDHFLAASAAHPQDPYFLTMAGWALKEQGERSGDPALLEQACEWYSRAIQLDPSYGHALLERGWALHLQRRPELRAAAVADIRRSCELRPRAGHPAYILGRVLLDQGERAQAIEAFRECLRREPTHADAAARLTGLGE